MSRLTCDCATANLPAIGATRCGVNFGMIEVMAFVKLSDQQADLSLLANVVDKTKWTAGQTAGKVQMSPMVKGWTPGGGDPVNVEEDTDPDGMGRVIRVNPVTAEVLFRGIKPAQADQMEKLQCLAELRDLGVYLFTPDGRVIGVDKTTSVEPIPVGYQYMAPRQFGNRDEFDSNTMTLKFDAEYMNDLTAVTLAYGTSGSETYWKGIDLLAVGTSN